MLIDVVKGTVMNGEWINKKREWIGSFVIIIPTSFLGMMYLHSYLPGVKKAIIHRDLKPSNLLVSSPTFFTFNIIWTKKKHTHYIQLSFPLSSSYFRCYRCGRKQMWTWWLLISACQRSPTWRAQNQFIQWVYHLLFSFIVAFISSHRHWLINSKK
jgi:serine/threonine protein kinase